MCFVLDPVGNLLADTIDNSISDDALASLIRMPGGCVEQNLASITLPLIATHYLDRSQQWESVGVQRRVEALNYIQRGEGGLCVCLISMPYAGLLSLGGLPRLNPPATKTRNLVNVRKIHI